MNLEEGEVFPGHNDLMSDEDWDSVDVTLLEQEAPVFGEKVNEAYQYLYDHVMDMKLSE